MNVDTQVNSSSESESLRLQEGDVIKRDGFIFVVKKNEFGTLYRSSVGNGQYAPPRTTNLKEQLALMDAAAREHATWVEERFKDVVDSLEVEANPTLQAEDLSAHGSLLPEKPIVATDLTPLSATGERLSPVVAGLLIRDRSDCALVLGAATELGRKLTALANAGLFSSYLTKLNSLALGDGGAMIFSVIHMSWVHMKAVRALDSNVFLDGFEIPKTYFGEK